jgi:hypothetical protein
MKKQVKKSTKKIVRKKTTKKVVRKKAQIKRVKNVNDDVYHLFETIFHKDGGTHYQHLRADLPTGRDVKSFVNQMMFINNPKYNHDTVVGNRMKSETNEFTTKIVAIGNKETINEIQDNLCYQAAVNRVLINRSGISSRTKKYLIATGQMEGKNRRVTDPNIQLGRLISTDSGKVFSGLFPDESSARGHYKVTNSWYKFEYVNPHQFPDEKIYYSVKDKVVSLQDKIHATKVAIANRRKGSNPYSI